MFTIYNDTENGSTIVSNLFIDEYMKDANDAQIKIYLYLLRALGSGLATSVADMADKFNHTEKDVIRSLRYWEKCGLLSIECDSCGNLSGVHMLDPQLSESAASRTASRVVSIAPVLEEKAIDAKSGASSVRKSAETKAPDSAAASAAGSRASVDSEALRSFKEDKKRETLLFVIEQYIGKPLSVAELKTVCYISETLHFSDDLVDYLVQYCVDRGKKDFRYIEKVALNWAEKGITTPNQAMKKASDTRKGNPADASAARARQGSFGHFEQRDYDWNTLEQKILNS